MSRQKRSYLRSFLVAFFRVVRRLTFLAWGGCVAEPLWKSLFTAPGVPAGPAATVPATPAEAYVGEAPAPSFEAIATKISHRPGLGRPRRCAGARGRAARRRRPRTTGRSRRRAPCVGAEAAAAPGAQNGKKLTPDTCFSVLQNQLCSQTQNTSRAKTQLVLV